MYLIKALLILLWFAVIPVCIGMLFTRADAREKNSLKMAALYGYITMFAVFEVLALPLIFAEVSFHVLMYVYGGSMLLLAVVSIILNVRRTKEMVLFQWKGVKETPWSVYLALILIAVQIGAYLIFRLDDLDDAFYVATATTTVHTNGMFRFDAYTGDLLKSLPSRYVLSPFPIFLAFISESVQMHPAIVAHTIMPVFFIPLAYIVYSLLGQKLFSGDRKASGIFLCFLSVIHLFSYFSVYTQGTFMLVRIWQGKAVLAAILLPALFYLCIRLLKEKGSLREWSLLLGLLLSCCLVSSMGIMLAPIMVGIFAILYGIGGKDPGKFIKAVICCIPCLICAGMYLLIR